MRPLLASLFALVVETLLGTAPLVAQAFTVRVSGADSPFSEFQRYHAAFLRLGLQISSADSTAGTLVAASSDPRVAVQVTIVARLDSFFLTLVAIPSPPSTRTDAFHEASLILRTTESTDVSGIDVPNEAHTNAKHPLGFMLLVTATGWSTDTLFEMNPAALPLTIGSRLESMLGGDWSRASCLRAFRSAAAYATFITGCHGRTTILSIYRSDGSPSSESFGAYAEKKVLICPSVNGPSQGDSSCPRQLR